MKKLITLITAAVIFTACKKNNHGIIKDELTSQEKIIIPMDESNNSSSAAKTDDEVKYNTFYGPVVQMGVGHARSWVNITHDNKALAIGIEMTEGALQLHDANDDGRSLEFVFPLHQKAKAFTPFDHFLVNWNEHGHPPPGIYDLPHFDFHFYKMSLAERLAIPAFNDAPQKFNNLPDLAYIPTGYFTRPNEGIIQMGRHWGDGLSPELHGQPFTHTFIYGSYDGKVTFLEPMITLALLQSGVTVQKAIRQPQLFDPVDNYYPTRYNIWKNENNNRHYVAMDQMVWR